MSAGIIKQALAAEQKRLAKLPHIMPDAKKLAEWYNGQVVYALCSRGDAEVRNLGFGDRARTEYRCPRCFMAFAEIEPVLQLPLHSRLMHPREIADTMIEQVAQVLGLGLCSDAALAASAAAKDSRNDNVSGRVAAGLPFLVAALVRQDASESVMQSVAALNSLRLDGDEHPFFSEAVLYERIGKDNARTVLSHMRGINAATGYSGAV